MNNEQRKTAFVDALEKLCVEHKCSLHVTDDGKSYGMHSAVLLVEMDSIIVNDEVVSEFQSFEITGHVNP